MTIELENTASQTSSPRPGPKSGILIKATPASSVSVTVVTSYNSSTLPLPLPGPEMKSYRVPNGSRSVRFMGQLLAFESSERSNVSRWSELSIYRTQGNQFVAHRVGISCVAHSINCNSIMGKNLPSVVDIGLNECPAEHRQPCPECRPDILRQIAEDPASLRAETDRHWAAICEDAYTLVQALHTLRNGVRVLNSVANSVLIKAAALDAQISAEIETDIIVA